MSGPAQGLQTSGFLRAAQTSQDNASKARRQGAAQEHRWGRWPQCALTVHQTQSKEGTAAHSRLDRENWLSFTVTRANSEAHITEAHQHSWEDHLRHGSATESARTSGSGITSLTRWDPVFTALSLCTFYLLLKMMRLVFSVLLDTEPVTQQCLAYDGCTDKYLIKGPSPCLFRPYEYEKTLQIK